MKKGGMCRLICAPDGVNEMLDIKFDVNKDIQAGNAGDVHRHKAAVAIMYKKVGFKGSCAEVINAAGTIRHIPHDVAILHTCKADGHTPSTIST